MTARSGTDEAINALKAVDKAERKYVKAQAEADKAEITRRKEKLRAAALTADRAFIKWRHFVAVAFGPDTFGPKG